jgi:DNA-binding IclR family transcriptional regulator
VKPTRTLLRGLEVLEVLGTSPEPVGPTRVAQLVGLDKATAGRLLFTLCEAGYATQTDTGSYRLTGKLLTLASAVSLEPELRDRARPHLLALRDATGETVHLGVREGDHVIYIDKLDGTHSIRLVSAIGQTMPLHTTALGKAALAWLEPAEREAALAGLELVPRTDRSITSLEALREELDRTRTRGFAVDDRENEDHASCIGAPILGAGGEVVGMLSLSGPSYRIAERLDELGERCRDAADRISRSAVALDIA